MQKNIKAVQVEDIQLGPDVPHMSFTGRAKKLINDLSITMGSRNGEHQQNSPVWQSILVELFRSVSGMTVRDDGDRFQIFLGYVRMRQFDKIMDVVVHALEIGKDRTLIGTSLDICLSVFYMHSTEKVLLEWLEYCIDSCRTQKQYAEFLGVFLMLYVQHKDLEALSAQRAIALAEEFLVCPCRYQKDPRYVSCRMFLQAYLYLKYLQRGDLKKAQEVYRSWYKPFGQRNNKLEVKQYMNETVRLVYALPLMVLFEDTGAHPRMFCAEPSDLFEVFATAFIFAEKEISKNLGELVGTSYTVPDLRRRLSKAFMRAPNKLEYMIAMGEIGSAFPLADALSDQTKGMLVQYGEFYAALDLVQEMQDIVAAIEPAVFTSFSLPEKISYLSYAVTGSALESQAFAMVMDLIEKDDIAAVRQMNENLPGSLCSLLVDRLRDDLVELFSNVTSLENAEVHARYDRHLYYLDLFSGEELKTVFEDLVETTYENTPALTSKVMRLEKELTELSPKDLTEKEVGALREKYATQLVELEKDFSSLFSEHNMKFNRLLWERHGRPLVVQFERYFAGIDKVLRERVWQELKDRTGTVLKELSFSDLKKKVQDLHKSNLIKQLIGKDVDWKPFWSEGSDWFKASYSGIADTVDEISVPVDNAGTKAGIQEFRIKRTSDGPYLVLIRTSGEFVRLPLFTKEEQHYNQFFQLVGFILLRSFAEDAWWGPEHMVQHLLLDERQVPAQRCIRSNMWEKVEEQLDTLGLSKDVETADDGLDREKQIFSTVAINNIGDMLVVQVPEGSPLRRLFDRFQIIRKGDSDLFKVEFQSKELRTDGHHGANDCILKAELDSSGNLYIPYQDSVIPYNYLALMQKYILVPTNSAAIKDLNGAENDEVRRQRYFLEMDYSEDKREKIYAYHLLRKQRFFFEKGTPGNPFMANYFCRVDGMDNCYRPLFDAADIEQARREKNLYQYRFVDVHLRRQKEVKDERVGEYIKIKLIEQGVLTEDSTDVDTAVLQYAMDVLDGQVRDPYLVPSGTGEDHEYGLVFLPSRTTVTSLETGASESLSIANNFVSPQVRWYRVEKERTAQVE